MRATAKPTTLPPRRARKGTQSACRKYKGGGFFATVRGILLTVAGIVLAIATVALPVAKIINGLRYRHRTQLQSFTVLAVLAVLRWWAVTADPLAIILMVLFGSAVILFRLRRKLTRQAEWAYTATCLTAATVGLLLVNLIGGDSHLLNGAWIAGWLGLSLPWWAHHATRHHDIVAPAMPREALKGEPVTVFDRWNTYIKDSKGTLGGVPISRPVPFDHGDTYTLRAVPYRHTLKIFQEEAPKIATGLDVPLENLVIEAHPDHPKSPGVIRMQHITRSPIEETVWFDRPRYEKGRILLGPYADGIGEAWLRLYEGGQSMWSTTLTGGSGNGKSRLTEIIAITALAMRDDGQHTVIFYIDGQDGASSPCLFKNATWAVGPDGALRMLAAIERIAAFRNKENRAHQPKAWTGFSPSAERPGILVIIDEAQDILEIPGVAKRLAKLGKKVRKLGISFLNCAHDYGLETMKDDTWRAALLGGNGIVMNVASRITGSLIPGLGIHPFDLPKIPGYAVVVGAKKSGIRTAPFRGRYAPDEDEKTRSLAEGKKVTVPTIDEWFERYPALELDLRAAKVAGVDYQKRHETALAERDELLAFIAGLDADADDLDQELTELVAEQAVNEPAGSDGQWTCAQRIQALDWCGVPEKDFATVLSALPSGTNASTIRKALDQLVKDEKLAKDTQGRFAVWRQREEEKS